MRRVAAVLLTCALIAGAVVAAGAGSDGAYKVRAIFDNAAFVVVGEDVKVAGVRVGRIDDLEVTPDHRAAVTLAITDPAYQDFRRDAFCKVRPQSLIGEEYVDCIPTRPRQAGEPLPPALPAGADGVRTLPVENTGASVDLDLIGETLRRPYRERLSIIINEFGTALAGRGGDLNDVIRRANPALKEIDGVLRLLARQNETLERLARDSDTIMAPLARERRSAGRFVENAGEVAAATAERREALQASLERFPTFLRELRPTMARLGALADEMTPVVSDLGDTAPRLNTLLRNLGPFSAAGTPALTRLGAVAGPGIPALRASLPIVKDLRALNATLRPVADTLNRVLTSFEKNEGLERLIDYIFFQATAINAYDSVGHFLRAALIVNVCTQYAIEPVPSCNATFTQPSGTGARAAAAPKLSEVMRLTRAVLNGADPDDLLAERKRDRRAEREPDAPTPAAPDAPAADPVPQDLSEPAPATAAPEPTPAPRPRPAQQLLDYLFGSDG